MLDSRTNKNLLFSRRKTSHFDSNSNTDGLHSLNCSFYALLIGPASLTIRRHHKSNQQQHTTLSRGKSPTSTAKSKSNERCSKKQALNNILYHVSTIFWQQTHQKASKIIRMRKKSVSTRVLCCLFFKKKEVRRSLIDFERTQQNTLHKQQQYSSNYLQNCL